MIYTKTRFRIDCDRRRPVGAERWFVWDTEGEYPEPVGDLMYEKRDDARRYAVLMNEQGIREPV